MGQAASFLGLTTTPYKVHIFGLDGVGKTTILYRIKEGVTITPIATVGINVENVDYKGVSLSLWDSRRGGKMGPLIRHYYQDTKGIIFVLDSTDADNLETAADELKRLLVESDLKDVPFLLIANKQDLENAMSVDEITKSLNLVNKNKNHSIHIQAACATEGKGLSEGLDWLCTELKKS